MHQQTTYRMHERAYQLSGMFFLQLTKQLKSTSDYQTVSRNYNTFKFKLLHIDTTMSLTIQKQLKIRDVDVIFKLFKLTNKSLLPCSLQFYFHQNHHVTSLSSKEKNDPFNIPIF